MTPRTGPPVSATEQPDTGASIQERLLALVSLQKDVYDELLQLSHDKKVAIVQGDVARLDAVIAAEECLLVHLGSLERQRASLLGTLAAQAGVAPAQLCASEIVWQDDGQRSRMQALQAGFGRTLDSVRQINEVNAQLLNMHLAYVQEILDMATQTVNAPSYDADGSMSSRRVQSARLYDRIL